MARKKPTRPVRQYRENTAELTSAQAAIAARMLRERARIEYDQSTDSMRENLRRVAERIGRGEASPDMVKWLAEAVADRERAVVLARLFVF